MDFHDKIITFPQNRVWRTYPGGRILDQLAGKSEPSDTHFPEDWIGSVTRATNPGRETIEEGVSQVWIGDQVLPFDQLLATDPEYFLGSRHIARYGARPQLLVKLLDSAIRLHFQCHPTAAFAREKMNEPSGKAEAYHILSIREGIEQPYVYIGFQHPPGKAEFRKWIEEQNLDSIESCFDKIPVQPGDTLFIPGGYPHAIGEGILMVEIMEPSDLAVRFEFEKAGYTLPESARFMGRGLDFCLDIFDYSKTSLEDIRERYFFSPKQIHTYPGEAGELFHLIGPETTPCMRIRKSVLRKPVRKIEDTCYMGIVTSGRATLAMGEDRRTVEQYEAFFYPAGTSSFEILPDGPVEILECYPPEA